MRDASELRALEIDGDSWQRGRVAAPLRGGLPLQELLDLAAGGTPRLEPGGEAVGGRVVRLDTPSGPRYFLVPRPLLPLLGLRADPDADAR